MKVLNYNFLLTDIPSEKSDLKEIQTDVCRGRDWFFVRFLWACSRFSFVLLRGEKSKGFLSDQ